MNVFIDCGAYNGDSVENFKNWSKVSFPDKKNWIIYAFEPNPKFKDYWDNQPHANIIFSGKAVWIEDTELEFAVDQTDTPLGSTVMSTKRNIWNKSPKIKVRALDFSEWLKQFKDDFVVLKMDIEGAEFKVLNKMTADDTDKIPHVLMVEFHPNKVVEYTTTYKNGLIRKLQKRVLLHHLCKLRILVEIVDL